MDVTDAASAEFILAGHSNKWALGAPRGYAGPPALVRRELFGRVGHFVVEETPLPRSDVYWQMYIDAARDRDALLSYQGSQHIVNFLFAQPPGFDFLEPLVAGPLEPGATIVPRRMVVAQLGPSLNGLRSLLRRLAEGGARRRLVIATPPPGDSLASFEKAVRESRFWQGVFAGQGMDISSARFVPARLMLKLWTVLQELAATVTREEGAIYVAVPAHLRDAAGFVAREYQLPNDFTHASDDFGQEMLKVALAT